MSCYTSPPALQTTLQVRHNFGIYFQHSLSRVVTRLSSLQGFKVNKTAEVHLVKNTFQLSFSHVPPTLRPSLHFSSVVSPLFSATDFYFFSHCLHALITCSANNPQLRISRYDRTPLSSEDLLYSAVIEVTQRTSTGNDEATTLTLPVPEDGNVRLEFRVEEEAVMLLIRVGI